MVSVKRSLFLCALITICTIPNAKSLSILPENASSVEVDPIITSAASIVSMVVSTPLPFVHTKPIVHPFNQRALVIDDFIPTLKQLLSIGSSRNKARARRALSLKLITLILQDDPVNSTEAITNESSNGWISPDHVPTPLLPSYWTLPEKATTNQDTATKWSSSVYSVIGKPATWTNGFGVEIESPSELSKTSSTDVAGKMNDILIETITLPSINTSSEIKALFESNVFPVGSSLNLRPNDVTGEITDEIHDGVPRD